MHNKNEYPGIAQFLNAQTTAQRVAAYQQIPELELERLWEVVSRDGSLTHLEFIYQKKLANSTLQQTLVDFWYGSDVHDWDDIVPHVIATKDIDKLKFILSKGAFKAVAFSQEFFDEVMDEIQDDDKDFLNAWMAVESKEAKDCLHQIFLRLMKQKPNSKLLGETLFLNHERFMTLERFRDYLNQVLETNIIDLFQQLYPCTFTIFGNSNSLNNVLLKTILKRSVSADFCRQALEILQNDRAHDVIHPVLCKLVQIKSPEHHDVLNGFISEFENELVEGQLTPQMTLALFNNPLLRGCLPPEQKKDAFLDFFDKQDEAKLRTFLSEDANLSFYYQCTESPEFLRQLSRRTYAAKINCLDLPHTGCIEHLNTFQQDAYYKVKSLEILKYIEVYREVNQRWSQEDAAFIQQMLIKKRQSLALEPGEQDRYHFLMKLRENPHLKYVEKGVALSLEKGLSTSVDTNNASKQMVIDTLDHCLKQHKKNPNGRPSSIFAPVGYCGALSPQAFVERLMTCRPIRELLPLSFENTRNKLLDTLQDSPSLQYCLTALLDIPSFYEKGMEKNFYVQTEDALTKQEARKIQEFEGAMMGLTRGQEKIMARLSRHYPLPTSFDHVRKRQELVDIFVQRYRANPLVVDGREMPLNAPWGLSEKQKQACLKHPLHAVIRYLSVPNNWMCEALLAPEIPQMATVDVRNRCAFLDENHIRALWTFWMAASDESEEMRPDEPEYTTAHRIEAFIASIAQAARAHNWDRTERELYRGYSNAYVDDLELDKPTCPHGAKQQIFQSLMYHPLKNFKFIDAKDMMAEFRRDQMLHHVKAQINLENYQCIFNALEDPMHANRIALRRFNLPRQQIEAYKSAFGENFPNGLPPIYAKLIDHCNEKNQNCHIFTCEDELGQLADNQDKLINHFVHQILAGEQYKTERQRWQRLFEDKAFGSEERLPLANMDFANQLESFVENSQIDDNFKEKFKQKFPNHELPNVFFEALEQFVKHNSAYLNAKDLIEDTVKNYTLEGREYDYTPYNQTEYLKQEKPITLRIALRKLIRFVEEHAGDIEGLAIVRLGNLIVHFNEKIEALFSPRLGYAVLINQDGFLKCERHSY